MPNHAAVELMGTLDEKFIANSVAFEAARPACTMVVDGGPLRAPDGRLDRELIVDLVRSAVARMPAMSRRLRRTPLGLTAPAWVAVEQLDYAFHVRFHPAVVGDGTERAELFSGRGNGPMRLDRPLWDILVAELDSGQVALIGRAQHALGDGIYGMRLIDALVDGRPFLATHAAAAERAALAQAPQPPRTGTGLLLAAASVWWSAQPGLGGAWREYSRKPFRRRLRRWGGRLARPVRNRIIARRGLIERMLPPRHSALAEFDLGEVRAVARAAGGSVSDLTVALALRAVARVLPDEAALLVPISKRERGNGGEQRNHIVMTRVTAADGGSLGDLVAIVARQVAGARDGGGSGGLEPRAGYASYLPWRPRRAYFGPAEVHAMTLWPVLEPRDEIAVFASSYHRRFTLAVTASAGIDLAPVVAEFERAIRGAGAVAGAVAEAAVEAVAVEEVLDA